MTSSAQDDSADQPAATALLVRQATAAAQANAEPDPTDEAPESTDAAPHSDHKHHAHHDSSESHLSASYETIATLKPAESDIL